MTFIALCSGWVWGSAAPDVRAEPSASTASGREAPEASEVPFVTDEILPGDPLAPVEAAFRRVEAASFQVTGLRRRSDRMLGDHLVATVSGPSQEALVHILGTTAQDGYLFMLRPLGAAVSAIEGRLARFGRSGVFWVGVDRIVVEGVFLRGEDAESLAKIADITPGELDPRRVIDDLGRLGYRATLSPRGPATLGIRVSPGRSLRRIRVRGALPLQKSALRRALTLDARPGVLAPGECVDPALLRHEARPPLCAPEDITCQEWESAQRTRVESFLFEQGYLRGKVSFALVCGRSPDEVDLYVFLDKGRAFRIRRRDIRVTGNLEASEHRFLRRTFQPTVSPFLPIPRRLTRAGLERARERVEREYAEPRRSFTGPRTGLKLPYPSVRVTTSFDRIDRSNLDALTKTAWLPLTIDVQLGQGVQTSFLGNDRISEGRLRGVIQTFAKREAPGVQAAAREAENLRSYYQARGFFLADVEGRFEDFGGLKRLNFVIREGPKARIEHVERIHPRQVPATVIESIEAEFRKDRKLKRNGRITDSGVRSDLESLLNAYRRRGYLCAQVTLKAAFWPGGLETSGAHATFDPSREYLQTTGPRWLERDLAATGLTGLRARRRLRVYARIEVAAGPRVLTSGRETLRHLEVPIGPDRNVDDLPLLATGAWNAQKVLRDGPLRRRGDARAGGIPLTPGLERDVERDVGRRYRVAGYPLADAEVRWRYDGQEGDARRAAYVKDLASPASPLCQESRDETVVLVAPELYVYEGKQGTFGTTLWRGNFKTRSWVLRRETAFESGAAYDVRLLQKTQSQLDGTAVAESVEVAERPVGCANGDPGACRVHHVVTIREANDKAMGLAWGVGFATLDPAYAFVRPSFPNLFGTAWNLQLDGHYGVHPSAFERSARSSLSRPRIFSTPLTFNLSGQIQRRQTPARGIIDSALAEVRIVWPISKRWSTYFGYLFQIANISKDLVKPSVYVGPQCGPDAMSPCPVLNRGEAIIPDQTGALQTGVSFTTADRPLSPTKGIVAAADAKLASPYLGGWDWWLMLDFDWQQYLPLPNTKGRLSFLYMLRYGHAVPLPMLPGADTTSIPEVWRYFGGGTAGLGLRGIKPQTMLVDLEEVRNQYGQVTLRPTAQGGHVRAIGTMALQVVSARNFLGGALAHSLFFDFGVLAQKWQGFDFNRDFRRSVGVNFLKWDIRIVMLSLGYAVLIPNRIWPGNVKPADDRNGRFVFDVGVTF